MIVDPFWGFVVQLAVLPLAILVAWYVIRSATLSALRQHHAETVGAPDPDDPTPLEF